MSTVKANAVRWTPARIQRALLCPKPRGAIARARAVIKPGALTPLERTLIRYIADHAGRIDLPAPQDWHAEPNVGWLLVPCPRWVLHNLELFESEIEECKGDSDGEEDTDAEPDEAEPDADEEPDGDEEPIESWGP